MPKILRNILAFILGVVIGSAVNMGIVLLSDGMIPLPEGVDATNTAGFRATMHLMTPKHYFFPFLAHALGTLVGAYIASAISISNHTKWAFAVGVLFMIGGVTNLVTISSPTWFTIVDLSLAYLPMALLGTYLRRGEL